MKKLWRIPVAEASLLMKAISFAARAHRHQLRKDGITPYAAHPCRVAMTISVIFGIQDIETLAAAVLHDTIEDTTTDYDDLHASFGDNVAYWVGVLTKDMRLPESTREADYEEALINGPWQVWICKLADLYDNVSDTDALSPAARDRSLGKALATLNAFAHHVPPEAQSAYAICTALVNSKLTLIR
jgi:guanosine-3',5'-bis(diphosphate) 3'-pyrophosphohydrolase